MWIQSSQRSKPKNKKYKNSDMISWWSVIINHHQWNVACIFVTFCDIRRATPNRFQKSLLQFAKNAQMKNVEKCERMAFANLSTENPVSFVQKKVLFLLSTNYLESLTSSSFAQLFDSIKHRFYVVQFKNCNDGNKCVNIYEY